jgi:hypothetical protein
MTLNIGNVAASRHDASDVVRLRRELRDHGLDEQHHEKVLAACRAANILNDQSDASYVAASADDVKKARLAKLSAAMETPTGRSNVEMLRGILARGGVALDDVAGADRIEVDKLFAQSRLTTLEKMQCKSLLHRFAGLA